MVFVATSAEQGEALEHVLLLWLAARLHENEENRCGPLVPVHIQDTELTASKFRGTAVRMLSVYLFCSLGARDPR